MWGMATFAAVPLEVDDRIWRMPIERYHEMVQSGALGPEDRIELLEGVLVEKMSKNPPHVFSAKALARAQPAGAGGLACDHPGSGHPGR